MATPAATPATSTAAPNAAPNAPAPDISTEEVVGGSAGAAKSSPVMLDAKDAKDGKTDLQRNHTIKLFARDGKWFARIASIAKAPKSWSWTAPVPTEQAKALPAIHDLITKAFNNTEPATPLQLTLNGTPKLEAGVKSFDTTVVITQTPLIKFQLSFVRDDYNIADGSFQRLMEVGRKWVKVGDINDYDNLIKLYPVTEYEWGGTHNHVIPQPLVILNWSKGLRVGFQNSYPQGDSMKSFAVGTEFWTRGLADSPADANGRFKHGYYRFTVDPRTAEASYVLTNPNGQYGGLTIWVRRY